MTSPVPIDIFTRYMALTFDERRLISVPTGFQVFFGNPASGGRTHYCPDSATVDIDIIRGNKKIAALIQRGMLARSLGSTQQDLVAGRFTTFNRKFPLIEEMGNINAGELLDRMAGEDPYNSGMTRFNKMRDKSHTLHMEGVRRICRLFEVLAGSSILTGKMPAIMGTEDAAFIYDFKRRADHLVTVDTAWDAAGDVFGDLESACDKIEDHAGLPPDMLCVGASALTAMANNAEFQNLADNRRIELIDVSIKAPVPSEYERFVKSGWIAQGRLRTPKGYTLWVFTYNRMYQDEHGNPVKLMPEGKAFITSSKARCDRYFGPPEMLPMITERVQLYKDLFGFDPKTPPMPVNILNRGAVIDPRMFHNEARMSPDGKTVNIITQSAPIFATTQTDAFVTLDGLVTE